MSRAFVVLAIWWMSLSLLVLALLRSLPYFCCDEDADAGRYDAHDDGNDDSFDHHLIIVLVFIEVELSMSRIMPLLV